MTCPQNSPDTHAFEWRHHVRKQRTHPMRRFISIVSLWATCWLLTPEQTALASDPPISSSYDADVADIRQRAAFEEPLVPIGELSFTHEEETAALRATLDEYLAQEDLEALDLFVEFTQQYPDSAWNITVLTNVGFSYRRTGYYSRALDAFERAWELAWDVALYDSQGSPDEAAATHAARALAELAELYARLGRIDELSSLLSEVNQEFLSGPATEKVARAAEGLWMMENHPDRAFRCGPYAVGNILKLTRPGDVDALATVEQFGSTPEGLSLTAVATLASDVQLDLRMAYRDFGAAPASCCCSLAIQSLRCYPPVSTRRAKHVLLGGGSHVRKWALVDCTGH